MQQRTSPTDETRPDAAPQLSLVRLAVALRPLVLPTLVAAAIGALAVIVWVRFVQPERYSAAALLLIQTGAGRESGSFLSLQAYQQLLESDEVVARTARQLQKSFPDRKPRPRVGQELLTRRVGDAKGAGESARLLRVEVRGTDPEVTAASAEVWISTFLDKCETLASGTVEARARELDEKLGETSAEEEGLQSERRRLAGLVEGAYQESLARWDRRLAVAKAQARQELAEFDAETRRQVQDFEARHEMEVRRLKVATLAEAFRRLALSDADTPMEDGGGGTEATPEAASLDTSAPDAGTDPDGAGEPAAAVDSKEDLAPGDDVADIKRKLMTKGDKVRRDEALLERLERQRQDERRAVEDRQALELQQLERQRQSELYAAAETQAEDLMTVERQLRDAETVLTSLVRRRSALDVKRSGCGVEVAAAAVRPAHSEPRRTLPKAFIGLVVGAALGFLLALARHAGGAGRAPT